MLTCEKIFAPKTFLSTPISSEIESGSAKIELGNPGVLFSQLYPGMITPPMIDYLNALYSNLSLKCQPLHDAGGRIYVRGSTSDRVILEQLTGINTPVGWETPKGIWRKIIADNRFDMSYESEAELLAGHQGDLDHALLPHQNTSLRDISKTIWDLAVKHGYILTTIIPFQYARIDIVILQFRNGFWAQFHRLPLYTDQSVDVECRTSWYMPARLAFSGLYVEEDSVFLDDNFKDVFFSDQVFPSFNNTNLVQAIVSLQRYWLKKFWYDKYRSRIGNVRKLGGVGMDEIDYEALWRYGRNSYFFDRDLVEERQTEIATNNLLLLTCQPDIMAVWQQTGYLNQLKLGQVLPRNFALNIDQQIYRKAFEQNQLDYMESCPVILAQQLGIPLKKLIHLLRVRV